MTRLILTAFIFLVLLLAYSCTFPTYVSFSVFSCTSLSYNQLQELKSSSDSLVKDSMDALSELERGLSDANKKLQRMDADQHAKVGRSVGTSVGRVVGRVFG